MTGLHYLCELTIGTYDDSRDIEALLGIWLFPPFAGRYYPFCHVREGYACPDADRRWQINYLPGAGNFNGGGLFGCDAVDSLDEGPGGGIGKEGCPGRGCLYRHESGRCHVHAEQSHCRQVEVSLFVAGALGFCLFQGTPETDACVPGILNPSGKDEVLLLSGRTAIDCICRDMQLSGIAGCVYMPAYCCSSMIAPFIRNGFSIKFYDVGFDGGKLTYNLADDREIDILYLNNYFGFRTFIDIEWIRRKQKEGTVIIYDKTHSLFLRNDPYMEVADYILCSLRKWLAVASGAILYKRSCDLIDFGLRECGYVQTKFSAQVLKARYLSGEESVSKEMFYPAFSDFSHHLEEDYAGYRMDEKSIALLKSANFTEIISRRRENARMLYAELRYVGWLKFLFSEIDNDVTPLFVPVIVKTQELRDELKKQLISRQIYCPVHWPRNSMTSPQMEVNKIFEREISLICDQRYTPGQLERMVQTIKNLQ